MNMFKCGCKGQTKIISDNEVLHACSHKYSPATSYYDGIPKFTPYKRYGKNWFVEYIDTPIK